MSPDPSRPRLKTFALVSVIVLLVLFAGALLAVLFGRGFLLTALGKKRVNPRLEELFKMQRLEFPAVSQDRRDAFDVRLLHEDSPKEWWYLNAHLFDDQNNLYALMIALLKDGNLYGILTDVKNRRKAIISVQEASVQHDPATGAYSVGSASIRQPDPRYFCYEFKLFKENVDLDLEACANKPPLAVNGTGQVSMGLGGESRYYSLTNLSVRGTGRLDEHSGNFRGRAWIDRQWGHWSDQDFDRWDWFSIQLEAQTEIMLFVFSKDGRIVRKFGDVFLPDQMTRHNVEFKITPTATWLSPETGITWDTGWEIGIPEFNARLKVDADFQDHEVTKSLWEGGTKVSGRYMDRPVFGRGFFEARRKDW